MASTGARRCSAAGDTTYHGAVGGTRRVRQHRAMSRAHSPAVTPVTPRFRAPSNATIGRKFGAAAGRFSSSHLVSPCLGLSRLVPGFWPKKVPCLSEICRVGALHVLILFHSERSRMRRLRFARRATILNAGR